MGTGWDKVALGDLVTFRNGLNFTRSASGTEVKILGVGDFGRRESISDFARLKMIRVEGEVKDESLLKDDDLVFVRSNGNRDLVGRCMLIRNISERVVFSGFTIRARLKSMDVDPIYLSKVMHSHLFTAHLHGRGGGSSISNLSQGILSDFPVPLPSREEQRKIADVAQTWDAALEALDSLLASVQKQRHWLRCNVLDGSLRLPGFSGEWNVTRLGELLHEHGNRSTGVEDVYSVSVHKGLVNQIEHLGRSFAAKTTNHYNRVSPGDIVYTKSPTGDFPLGIIKQSTIDHDALVSPLYGVFSPTTYALGTMLNAYFESPALTQRFLHPLVQKGAKNTISVTNQRFLEGQLPAPVDQEEQLAIARVLDYSSRQIALIRTERDLVARQKRHLMGRLLAGDLSFSRKENANV